MNLLKFIINKIYNILKIKHNIELFTILNFPLLNNDETIKVVIHEAVMAI